MADFDPDAYLKEFAPKAQSPKFDPDAYLREFGSSAAAAQGPASTSATTQVSSGQDLGLKEIPYPSNIPAGPTERTPEEMSAYLKKPVYDESALGQASNAIRAGARTIGAGVAHGVKGILELDPAAVYSRMDEKDRQDVESHLDSQIAPAQKAFDANPDSKNPLTGKYFGDELKELQRQKVLVDRGRQIRGDPTADPSAYEDALKPDELAEAYGADPNLEHTKAVAAAKILGGIGGFVGEGAVNPAIPLLQMVSQASSEAGDAAVDTAKTKGETDEKKLGQIRDHAAARAASYAAATIPIYMAGGKLASTVGKAIASPIARAAAETGVSAAANTAIGAGIRRLENGKWQLPSGEQVAQDVGWAVLHGIHSLEGSEGDRAREAKAFKDSISKLPDGDLSNVVKQFKSLPDTDPRKVALDAELARRTTAPSATPTTAPAGAQAPSEALQGPVVQPVSQEQGGGELEKLKAAMRAKSAQTLRDAVTPEAEALAPATAEATKKAADALETTPSKAEVESPASGQAAQPIAGDERTPAPQAEAATETAPVEPQNLTPSIETPEGVKTGDSHQEIIDREGLPQEVKESPQAGFQKNDTGEVLSREQAADQTGLPTNTEEGKLHSSDLPQTDQEPQPAPKKSRGRQILDDIGDEEPVKPVDPQPEAPKKDTAVEDELDIQKRQLASKDTPTRDKPRIRARIRELEGKLKPEPEQETPPQEQQESNPTLDELLAKEAAFLDAQKAKTGPKELWQMTRSEAKDEGKGGYTHMQAVKEAVKRGDAVPPEVLKEFQKYSWAQTAEVKEAIAARRKEAKEKSAVRALVEAMKTVDDPPIEKATNKVETEIKSVAKSDGEKAAKDILKGQADDKQEMKRGSPESGASTLIPDIAEKVVNAGRIAYEKGMQAAQWAKKMVTAFGEKVRPYLESAWKAITGSESGALGAPGGGGRPLGEAHKAFISEVGKPALREAAKAMIEAEDAGWPEEDVTNLAVNKLRDILSDQGKTLDEQAASRFFSGAEAKSPKPVEFVMPERAIARGDKQVAVDIGKFDEAFAKDKGFYVSPSGEGAIAGRIQGFKDFLNTGKPVEMPEVSVDDEGNVGFTNGRHRYSVLRDQGDKTMPMAMSAESAENAEKFGLTQKTEGGDSRGNEEEKTNEKGQEQGVLTPPGEGEGSTPAPEPETTSLKRAVVDAQRRGEEIPTPTRTPIDQVIDEARQRITENPTVAPELISRIVDRGETAVSREEAATVLAERRRVINERNQWEDALGRADTPEAQRDLARVKLAEIEQQMDRLDQASRAAGSAWSDVGRMYQVDLKSDFSREALERKERAVRGRPLTEAESNKIKEQAAEISRLEKEVEGKQKAEHDLAEAQEVSRVYEQTIADLKKQLGKNKPEPVEKKLTKPISERIVALAKSARESALARIKERKGKLFADPIGVMSALDLADHAIVGATHLIEGSVTFGKWSKKMIEDFGNGVKPHLRVLFDASKAQAKKMLEKPEKTPGQVKATAKAEAVAGEPLNHKTVYDLARAHIQAGVHGEDNVMQAVHADIKEAYPDATERDVRRAFSEYGKVKFPSKEAVAKELREIRTLTRLQESIDRETEGLSALHSGLQRDKATQSIREKQKQLNELLKARQGEPSPEKLASREEAKQTALRNAIADLDKQLRTGESPEKRAPTPDSPATEQLRAERDAMREKLREIEAEKNPPKSDAEKQIEALEKSKQKLDDTLSGKLDPKKAKDFQALSQRAEDIKAEILAMQELAAQMKRDALPPTDPGAYSEKRQIDALEKAIERYSKKTADKDFTPTAGKKLGPDSLKVSELKEIRDSRREMYDAVKNLGKVVKTPDEIYNERRMKDVTKRIAELEARNNAGDFAPRPKPVPKVKTPETKRAEVKLAQAKEDIARGWARMEDANKPKWKKALEQVAGAARFSALSGYHTLAKLAGYDVSKFIAQPLQEGAGAVLQRTPGLRGVFDRSTMEKTDFARDMKNFYAGAAVKGMKQAARVLREGKTESGLLHGKKEHLNPKWYDFIGRLHYAEKAPLVTGTEEMYLARAYDAAIRDGLDPNDEFVKAEINRAAWEHSQAAILQENNKFAEAVNGLHARLEAANPKSKNLEITNQVISTLVKTLLTKGIVRTPANYIAQTIKSTPIGLITGLSKAAVANHRGIGNLHPAEANAISRLIKVGAVGSAFFLLGAIDATKKKEDRTFGGYWEPGRTRDGKDVDWGTIRIDGHKIPHLVTHNPLTESAQMGSTMMRVALSKFRKNDKDEQGLTAGAVKAIVGLATKAPIASPLMRAGEMRGDFMGDIAAALVPQLIQNIAEDTDPYETRAPVTAEEKLKATIPGLREEVPLPRRARLKATR